MKKKKIILVFFWKFSFPNRNLYTPIVNSKRTHLNKVGTRTLEWRLFICSCCSKPSSFNTIIEGRSIEVACNTMPGTPSIMKKIFITSTRWWILVFFLFCVILDPRLCRRVSWWRLAEDVFSVLSSKACSRRVCKTSWKMKNRYAQDVFKTCWKTRNVCWVFSDFSAWS